MNSGYAYPALHMLAWALVLYGLLRALGYLTECTITLVIWMRPDVDQYEQNAQVPRRCHTWMYSCVDTLPVKPFVYAVLGILYLWLENYMR